MSDTDLDDIDALLAEADALMAESDGAVTDRPRKKGRPVRDSVDLDPAGALASASSLTPVVSDDDLAHNGAADASSAPVSSAPASPAAAPAAQGGDDIESLFGEVGADRASANQDAEDFLSSVDKSLKQLTFYEGRGKNVEQSVAEAHGRLTAMLDRRGEVSFGVTPYEMLLADEPVYISEEDKKGMTFRLFHDGVREITFVPGMEADEFRGILDLLRQASPGTAEDNIVTALWEREDPHLKFRAIELFQEGLADSDMGGSKDNIGDIAKPLKRSLHGERTAAGMARVKQASDPAALQQFSAQVDQIRTALSGADPAPFLEALPERLDGMQTDVWNRAIHLTSRMVRLEKGASHITEVLAVVLAEMLHAGRWEMLAETLTSVEQAITGGKKGAATDAAMDAVLSRLCSESALLGLAPRLQDATAEEFEPVAQLFRLLPGRADPILLQLLVKMPPGEAQAAFRKLLSGRGVDLTDLHIRNLRGGSPDDVLAALAELKAAGTPRAFNAIASVLGHKVARVQVEALRLLQGQKLDPRIADKVVPKLIPSLASGHEEMRDLCFNLLATLERGAFGGDLMDFVKESEPEKWEKKPRRRIFMLMARWGGKGVDEYIVKQVTGSSLFRRKKVEMLRKDYLVAIKAVGGARAKKLLADCLDTRGGKAIRGDLEQALKKLGGRS